jgi:hypothetical protein
MIEGKGFNIGKLLTGAGVLVARGSFRPVPTNVHKFFADHQVSYPFQANDTR